MLISPFSHLFIYHNGKLYWSSGKRIDLEAGTLENDGYIRISVKGYKYYAHVIIFSMFSGRIPSGIIDHKNGIRTDNRFENLLECSIRRNSLNRVCRREGKIPGVKVRGDKFVARIKILGREKYIGSFDNSVEAYEAYMKEFAALEEI